MMKRLDKYIGSSVIWSFFAVSFVLLGLDYLLAFIDQIKKTNDYYTLSNLASVLLYHLPSKFTEYIPIASLIGTLIGLGALASTSELTVIRAAGVPLWRIGFAAVKPLLIIALIGVGISEFVAPPAEQKANLITSLRWQKNNDYVVNGGAWLRSEKSFIYINAATQDGTLYNIEIYNQNNHTLESAIKANTAKHLEGNKWLLKNVSSSVFYPDHIDSEYLPQKIINISFKPEHLFLAAQNTDSLSLSQLLIYQRYLRQQDLDTSRYQLEFWTKILRPVATIALMIVALSSVFGPLRSSTMGGRIFSGVIIGIIFQNGLNLFGRMSLVAHFSPILGILIPIGICLVFGLIQLRRLK